MRYGYICMGNRMRTACFHCRIVELEEQLKADRAVAQEKLEQARKVCSNI